MFILNAKSLATTLFLLVTASLLVFLLLAAKGQFFGLRPDVFYTNRSTQVRPNRLPPGQKLFKKVSHSCSRHLTKISMYSPPHNSTFVYSNSTESKRRCLKNYFEDVLLVITFHYPFYDTLPLILQNYEGAFPNIAVCGPQNSSSYNVIKVDLGPGHYGFECLGKAVRLCPGFKGYLYVNDDMIVNWWNFVKFDKNKIWMGAPISDLSKCHIVGQRPIRRDWNWWTYTKGAKHCEKTHKEIKKLAEHGEYEGMDFKKMMSTFLQNGKNQTYCLKGWSDTFYVPGRFSKEFQYLSGMFFKNRVFLEISVPTILSFLDLHQNWQKGYGTYLPDLYGFVDFVNGGHPWKVYSVEKTLFIHPVKFHAKNAGLNRKNLKEIVIAHGNGLLRC